MAQTPEGIMALPNEPQAAERPQLTLTDSYDVARTSLQNAQPEAAAQYQQIMDQLMPMLDQLSDTQLDQLLQLVQYLQDNEEQYPEIRKKLIAEGMDEEDLPPEYDPEYFAVIGTVVLEAIRVRSAAAGTPPQQFARGGIAQAAHMLASKGRGQDTQLAHITPAEARMLRKKGGVGTINPDTGLPEFGIWGSIVGAVKGVWKTVSGAVKSILKNPIGRFISTVALSTFIGYPAASAAISLASGENLKTALISAGTAWLSGPTSPLSGIANRAASTFLPQAANAAVRQGVADTIVGTGVSLITGKSLSDSVKSGLTNAALSYGATTASAAFPKNRINSPFASVNVNDPQIVERSGLSPEAFALRSPKNYYDDADNIFDRSSMSPSAASLRANTSKPYGNADIEALSGRSPLAPTFSGMDGPNISPSPYSLTSQNFPDMGDAQGLRLNNAPAGLKIATPEISDIASNRIASTSANRASQPSGGIPSGGIPDIRTAAGEMYQGMKDLDYEKFSKGAGDLFMPGTPSPSSITGSQQFKDLTSQGISADKAYSMVEKSMTPGMLRTYGPGVAAGLGVMGLTGGFQQNIPQVDVDKFFGPSSADLMKADPRKYYVQNIPGVTYDQRGAVVPRGYEDGGTVTPDPLDPKNSKVGTKYVRPQFTMDDIRVATPTLEQREAEMANYTPVTSTMTAATEPGINNPAYQNISKMYQDVLGRAPDAEGMKYWMSTIGADRSISPKEKTQWMVEAAKENPSVSVADVGYEPSESYDEYMARISAEKERQRLLKLKYPDLSLPREPSETEDEYMARINAKGTGTAPFAVAEKDLAGLNMGPQGIGKLAPPVGFDPSRTKSTVENWKTVTGGIADIPTGQQIGVTDAPGYRGRGTQPLPAANTGGFNAMNYSSNMGAAVPPAANTGGFNAMNYNQPWYMQEANYNRPDAAKARAVSGLAAGGIADMASAYPMNTGGYPRRTGQIAGPGTEKSDSIPAMLSDGEFVMTSRAVRGMGKGSRRDGAKKMYALMHQLEKNASRG